MICVIHKSTNERCPSLPSPLSVPCGPQNVTTSVACSSGALTVGWSVSVPGENYTAVVSTGTGDRAYCNSTQTQCTLGGLACGRSYNVTVFSVHGSCLSMPSADAIVEPSENTHWDYISHDTLGLHLP